MNTQLHQARYTLEHQLLPTWFFEEKQNFINMLLKQPSILHRIFSDICEEKGIENPYTPDQFQIEPAKLADDLYMLKINFPTPESEPLCFCNFMFFSPEFTKASFFCIERGSTDESEPFVCGWNAERRHLNYGNCTMEENDDFKKCLEIFVRSMFD